MIRFLFKVDNVCYYEDNKKELRWAYCTCRDKTNRKVWKQPTIKQATGMLK